MKKKFWSVLLSVFMLMQCMGVLPAQAQCFEAFDNGGFENGLSGWYTNGNGYSASTADKRSGTQSLTFSGSALYSVIKQPLSVEKNTDYVMTFYVKKTGGQFEYSVSNAGGTLATSYVNNDSADWTIYDISFNSGNYDEVVFQLKDTLIPTSAYFDDFKLINKSNGLINGSFEDGKYGWSGSFNAIAMEDAPSGNTVGQWWGPGTYMYQTIPVAANTWYNLSFWYKNTNASSNYLNISVLDKNGITDTANGRGPNYDTANWISSSLVEDWWSTEGKWISIATEWTQVNEKFYTGSNTEVTLVVAHVVTSYASNAPTAYYDDFVIAPIVEEEALIVNGDFEEGTEGKDGWGNGSFNSIEMDDAPSGSRVGQWWGYGSYTYQTISVEPNTEHTLTFWYKNTSDSADESNWLRVGMMDQNGINSSGEGTSLIEDGWGQSGKIYQLTTEWTKVTETFNTGSNTEVTLVIAHNMGAVNPSTTTYYDNFVLEPVSYEFKNADFESGDMSSWTASNAVIVEDEVHGGQYAAKLEDENQQNYATLTKTINVEQNKNYTLSYWYYNKSYGHNLSIYDGNYSASAEALNRVTDILQLHDVTTGWTQVTQTFNTGSNKKVTIALENCNQQAVTYFDDFELTCVAPVVLEAKALGYVAEGKTLYAYADNIDPNGDTLTGINYQWQYSDDGETWSNVPLATEATYTVTADYAAKKLRVAITPVGASNTGKAAYSDAVDSNSQAAFEASLVLEINELLGYLPGWFNDSYKDYAQNILVLDKAANEYGVALSKDNIKSWNNYINTVSKVAGITNIDVTCGDAVTVKVDFEAAVRTDSITANTFVLYNANDKSAALTNYTLAPADTFTYTLQDGTTTLEMAKGMVITLDTGYEVKDYVLNKIVNSLTYTYNFAAEKLITVVQGDNEVNGTAISVTASIKSDNVNGTALVIAGVYETSTGKLVDAASENVTLTKGAEAVNFAKTLEIPENADSANYNVRLFVWDNNMRPFEITAE